jgi:hypothetical protein
MMRCGWTTCKITAAVIMVIRSRQKLLSKLSLGTPVTSLALVETLGPLLRCSIIVLSVAVFVVVSVLLLLFVAG